MSNLTPIRPGFAADLPQDHTHGKKRKKKAEHEEKTNSVTKEKIPPAAKRVSKADAEIISQGSQSIVKSARRQTAANAESCVTFESLPKEIKALIAQFVQAGNNWFDPTFQNLLSVNKQWHSLILESLLKGRGD